MRSIVALKRIVSLGCLVAMMPMLACDDDQVRTTTRNLLRPGPVGLACVEAEAEGKYAKGLPQERCSRFADATSEPTGTLFGLVANTARGDVALFKTTNSGEELLDLDPRSPGFGFLPVGGLPSGLTVSADSCVAVTANSGSCDLSVIDVTGALRLWKGALERDAATLVRSLTPHTKGGGPLLARPHAIVDAPRRTSTNADQSCDMDGPRSVYVSFPTCSLVAEVSLTDGLILRALKITADGKMVPTANPTCVAECSAARIAVPDAGTRDDVERQDASAGDARPDGAAVGDAATDGAEGSDGSRADANPADGGVGAVDAGNGPDSSATDTNATDANATDANATDTNATDTNATDARADLPPPTVRDEGILPRALALVSESSDLVPGSGRLFVSSGGANFITLIDIGVDGSFVGAERIQLEGERAETTRLAISPDTRTMGQFVYAVARDATVRVISVRHRRECETNMELASLPKTIDLATGGCYAVGSVKRRIGAKSPGITLGGQVPVDVAFATVGRCAEDDNCASEHSCDKSDGETVGFCRRLDVTEPANAIPLVGVYAYVPVTDGTVFIVDVEDYSRVSFTGANKGTVERAHLPHRARNSVQGDLEDPDHKPGLEVTQVFNGGAGGVPVVVTEDFPRASDNCSATCGAQDDCCPAGCAPDEDADCGPLVVRSLGESVGAGWSMVYEDRLVGRSGGQFAVAAGSLLLKDPGVQFCRAGVLGRREERGRHTRHGDIVRVFGCDDDTHCGINQTCNRVVGQDSEFGLCFDRGREEELFQQCGAFLRGKREFLVREARAGQLTLDILPEEPQRIIDRQDSGCGTNDDCPDGYLCALADRPVETDPDLSLTKGQCFLLGCEKDEDCRSGYCLAPLGGGRKTCAAAPLPLEFGGACATDDDCQPSAVGAECVTDADCEPAAECRHATSVSARKTCESRGRVCDDMPSRGKTCVRPSPCFSQLQRYEVLAGRSFIVGNHRRVVADPVTGVCDRDPSADPLFEHRIPVWLPVYPVQLGPSCVSTLPNVPVPNPCVARMAKGYKGFEAKGAAEGEREIPGVEGPTYQIHYANPDLAFRVGLSHLTTLPSTAAGVASFAPMPERGLQTSLGLKSGYARLSSALRDTLALPTAIIAGPDGYLYIVDMGDQTTSAGTRRGQVLRLEMTHLQLDNAFLAK